MWPSRKWRDRLAMYGVPSLAGLVTALILIGPGSERTSLGARVWGYPVAGSSVCALRLHTVAHYSGAFVSVAKPGLVLELRQRGRVVGSWSGASPKHGFVEAQLQLSEPLEKGAHLKLLVGAEVLVDAPLSLAAPLATSARPATVDSLVEPRLRVHVERGFLAPPFPELLLVSAFVARTSDNPEEAAPKAPELSLKAIGGEAKVLSGPTEDGCNADGCRHRWQLQLVAQAPTMELQLTVKRGSDAPLKWEGELPVRNGSVWLDPASVDGDVLKVRSPSVIDRVYLSLLTPSGRLWGAVLPMKAGERGFASAELAWPRGVEGPATLVVATEANERGNTAAEWPLHSAKGAVEPRPIEQLIDGMPALVAAELERRKAARRPAYGLVIVAGLFELLYLWLRNRRERDALEAHLRHAAEGLDDASVSAMSRSTPLLWLVVFLGALVLAFAVLAGAAAWG
jgi:hypothetical protein